MAPAIPPRTAFTTRVTRPCVSQCSSAAWIGARCCEARICAPSGGPTEWTAVSVINIIVLNCGHCQVLQRLQVVGFEINLCCLVQIQCGGLSGTATQHGRAALSPTDASGSFPREERAPSVGAFVASRRIFQGHPPPSTDDGPNCQHPVGPAFARARGHPLAPRRRLASARHTPPTVTHRTRSSLRRLHCPVFPLSSPTVLQCTFPLPLLISLLCQTPFGLPPATHRSPVVLRTTVRVAVVCACIVQHQLPLRGRGVCSGRAHPSCNPLTR